MASATLGLGKINMRQTPCIGDQLIALPQESEDSKGKANLFLCLTEHHNKTYWGNGGIATSNFHLGTTRRRVTTSRPGRFILGLRATDNHWIRGWVGPTAGVDGLPVRIFAKCSHLSIASHFTILEP